MEPEPEPELLNIILSLGTADFSASFVITSVLVVIILLIFSGLFSASENAFFSLSPSDISELEESELTSAKRALLLLNEPNKTIAAKRLLATILICNNFINIAIVILSSLSLGMIWEYLAATNGLVLSSSVNFLIEVVLITFLLVLFGEIIPKIYATQNNLKLVNLMSTPLMLSKKALYPLVYVLSQSSSLIDRYIKKKHDNVSLEELNQAIEIASEDDNIEEKNILKGIVNYGNISVKQIMRSRIDVCSLDVTMTNAEVFKQATEWGFSRVPVYKDSFDGIEGILYIKDLIPLIRTKESFKWQELMRKPFFVPENKKIDDLLEEFQEKRTHMAIVVDEYGGSSGIVTMEDILEEIFGEMVDEFDEDEIAYSRLDDNTYVFEGKVLLTDIVKILELRNDYFDTVKGEADTLGGLIMEIHQSIPSRGDIFQHEDYEFIVEAADKRRIKRVKMIKVEKKEEE